MPSDSSFEVLEERCKKGTLVLFPKFKFHQNTKPKYGLLIEDFDRNSNGTIVALITSNLKYKKYPSCVFLPQNSIPKLTEDSVIDCNNTFIIIHKDMARTVLAAKLPENILAEVAIAYTRAMLLPESIITRVALSLNPKL